MLRKLLERLRGSSRSPDDLSLGTKRPGDFTDPPEHEGDASAVVPNPHEEDENDAAP